MKSIEEIEVDLKKVLKKKRFQHTIGVRYTAQAMAMRFGEDIEKAGFAGMLHDCAKYLSDEEMLRECKNHEIVISETEKAKPSLLHTKLGVCYAKEKYDVEEHDILSAIRWHTTGKPSMSTLEKIVFIADYIEPGRKKLPNMEQIRKVSFIDLDEAMYLILKNTLSYLEEDGNTPKSTIDTYTVDAFDFYADVWERKNKISQMIM